MTGLNRLKIIHLQGEIESGALPDLALDPDMAVMELDNAFHNRQANAGAFAFRVQFIEEVGKLFAARMQPLLQRKTGITRGDF